MKTRSKELIAMVSQLAEIRNKKANLELKERLITQKLKRIWKKHKSVFAGEYEVVLNRRISAILDKQKVIAFLGSKVDKFLIKSKSTVLTIKRIRRTE